MPCKNGHIGYPIAIALWRKPWHEDSDFLCMDGSEGGSVPLICDRLAFEKIKKCFNLLIRDNHIGI